MSSKKRQRFAFTLAESLVAILVVAFLASILVPSYLFSSEQITYGRQVEEATAIAASQIEKFQKQGFDAIPEPAQGQSATTVPLTDLGELPGAQGSVTFTELDDHLNPTTDEDASRVLCAVNIKWQGAGERPGSVTLTTMFVPH